MSTGTIIIPAQKVTMSDKSTLSIGAGSLHVDATGFVVGSSGGGGSTKVTRSGTKLMLNGSEFRPIGVDMWSAASPTWYTPAVGNDVSLAGFDSALVGLLSSAPHVNAIRIFITSQNTWNSGSRDWSAVDSCLTIANNHGCRVVFTLEDYWDYERLGSQGSGLADQGPAAFYGGGWRITNLHGYHETYQQWVTAAVTRYAGDSRILMWELMNEPQVTSYAPASVQWATDASALIKSIDSVTPVCSGNQGSSATNATIAALANIDIITYHYYSDVGQTDYATAESQANTNGKPWFLGEYGVLRSLGLPTRASQVTTDLTTFFATSAPRCSGLLYWSYAPPNLGDQYAIQSSSDPALANIDAFHL